MADRAYPSRPISGALALVAQAGKILLVRRGQPPNLGLWGLPGGAHELGETIVEAACRELGEETGLAGDEAEIVDSFDAILRDAAGRIEFHYLLTVVRFHRWAGEPAAASDACAVAWTEPARFVEREYLPSLAPLMQRLARIPRANSSIRVP